MEAQRPDEARRGPDRRLVAIVALGAVVRLVNWSVRFGGDLGFNDSLYYSSQAAGLVRGRVFRELFSDHPGAEHGPLTALLMAPFSWGAEPHRWQRAVTVATGVATVWVVARLAEAVAGRRVGLVAGAIAALSPLLWMPSGLVMSESISMLLVALTLWALVEWGQSLSTRRSAALGALLGLGALARSELALMAVCVVLALVVANRVHLRRAIVAATVCAGVSIVVVAPWVAFNLVRFERPVLLTVNEGTTLQGANCDDTYHGSDTGGWSIFCADADPFMEPSVRTTADRERAAAYVRAHLGEVPRVVLARVARTLDLYGLADMAHQDVGEERPAWAVRVGVPVFWCSCLGAVGGAGWWRGRRRWPLVALMLPVATVLVTTVVFYGSHRIRSSAEPPLVVLAAIGLVWWWDRRRSLTSLLAVVAGAAIALAAIGPIRLTGDASSPPDTAALVAATEPTIATSSAPAAVGSSTSILDGGVEATLSLPEAPSRPVRVLVAGDSTAFYVGDALQAWAGDHPDHAASQLVWCDGCGFILDGRITSFDGSQYLTTSRQRFLEELPQLADSFDPDVIVLMVTVADIADREWNAAEGTLTPRDPRYVDRMREAYASIDALNRRQGQPTVVWVVPPVPATYFATADLGEADRYEVQHRVIRQVAASTGAVVCDLDAWFRAAGVERDTWWRPDGTHLTDESARRLVDEWLGPWLVRTALGLPTDEG
ncbi:MAG: GDSL-type esterase/lipase family protein [Ilumatobacteraceae bacterium]